MIRCLVLSLRCVASAEMSVKSLSSLPSHATTYHLPHHATRSILQCELDHPGDSIPCEQMPRNADHEQLLNPPSRPQPFRLVRLAILQCCNHQPAPLTLCSCTCNSQHHHSQSCLFAGEVANSTRSSLLSGDLLSKSSPARPPSNMLCGSVLDVLNAADLERAAIWQRHSDLSEEQRQSLYERRKAQIASSFAGSATPSRGVHREQVPSLALGQDVDQCQSVGALACLFSTWTNTSRRLDVWTTITGPALATTTPPHR